MEEQKLNNEYTIECVPVPQNEDKSADRNRFFLVNSQGMFAFNMLDTLLEERVQFIISAYDQALPFITKWDRINYTRRYTDIIKHSIGINSIDGSSLCEYPELSYFIRNTKKKLQNKVLDLPYIQCDFDLGRGYDFCQVNGQTYDFVLRVELHIPRYEESLKQQEETKKAEAERIEKQLAKYDRIGDRIADRLIAKYENLIKQNKGKQK